MLDTDAVEKVDAATVEAEHEPLASLAGAEDLEAAARGVAEMNKVLDMPQLKRAPNLLLKPFAGHKRQQLAPKPPAGL